MGLTGLASYRRLAELDARVDDAWQQLLEAYEARAELATSFASGRDEDPGVAKDVTIVTRAVAGVRRAEGISDPDADALAVFAESQSELEDAMQRLAPSSDALGTDALLVDAAREAFNEATLEYNRMRRRFPTVLIALLAGFPDRPYLDEPPEADVEVR